MASTYNAAQIQQLVTRARQAASVGQFEASRQMWQAILSVLPSDAPERSAVEREIERMTERLSPTKPRIDWRKRLGPLGVVIAFLAKFKTVAFVLLTKGKFLISMLLFLSVYWAAFGWRFATGFFATIFIHEMGHYVAVRRYGMKAELPMFIPFFGAYVRWSGANVDPEVRTNIALAGPFFGFLSGIGALALYFATGERVFIAIAQIAGWLNLLNLIPVGFFDGGRAMDTISQGQRTAILALSVAMLFIAGQGNLLPWIGVAAATGYRLYKRDVVTPRDLSGYYFIVLAVANGLLSWYCTNVLYIQNSF